jgi:restriction system protein
MINPLDTETFTELSSEDFEKTVKEILKASAHGLDEFNAIHREQIKGLDGSYEIDVTARFRALGADFLVLVECKHHKNPIKREMVQVLHNRVQSVGAQKGMLFSTCGFQKGAIEYAEAHGIALVRIVNGKTCYETFSLNRSAEPPSWAEIPPYIGWLIQVSGEGTYQMSIISKDMPEYMDKFLAQNNSD